MENGMRIIWTQFCFCVQKAINPECWQSIGFIMRILAMLSAGSSAVRGPNVGDSQRRRPSPSLNGQMFLLKCYGLNCCFRPCYKSLVSEMKFVYPSRLEVLNGLGPSFKWTSFGTSMKPLVFIAPVRSNPSGDGCFIYSNVFVVSHKFCCQINGID